MPSPSNEPVDNLIMSAIAARLAADIKPDNGYYNQLGGAGIEPLAFDGNDNMPQIVVREETSTISDTKKDSYQDTKVLALTGYNTILFPTVIRDAIRLREDITSLAAKLRAVDFRHPDTGVQMVSTIELTGERSIKNSDEVDDVIEVIVRVKVTYRKFFPRPEGGL